MSKRITGSIVIYMGGEIVNKAIPFLLLPLLTAFLSPNDFGIVSTYQAVLQVCLVLISLSMHAAVSVFFFKVESGFFKKILASIFLSSTLAAVIVVFLIIIFQKNALQFLGVSIFWVLALPFIALFQASIQFFLVYFQVRKMEKGYVIFQSLNTVVNTSTSIVLIVFWDVGLEGRIAGIAVAAVIFGLWSVFDLKRNNLFDFNVTKKSFSAPLRFSLPLIPHALSSWLKTSVDRVLIMLFLGALAVGEYAVIYQLAMILSVVFMAVNKAMIPYLFGTLKKGGYNSSIVRSGCKKIAFVIVVVSMLYALIVPVVFSLIIDSSYKFEYLVVFLLIVGFMFQGLYLLLINFFMFYEKTKLIAKISIINSILHLLLVFPFVYFYGGLGAAIANCISWLALLLLTYYYGNQSRIYPWCAVK